MVGPCLLALALYGGPTVGAGPLPEGPGLAAAHPGDAGIAEDTAVIFAEGFEEGTLSEVVKRWDSASDKDGRVLSLSDDVPFRDSGAGARSLKISAHPGQDTG